MEGIEELRAKIIELENEIKLLKEGHKTKREKMKAENPPSLVPCKCSVCEKEFKNKYILKTHMKLHQDKEERKIQCPVCHKYYSSKYYLSKHMKNKHESEKQSEATPEPKAQESDTLNVEANDQLDDINDVLNNEQ